MDVRCELDRLITQIRHLTGIIEGAFERAGNLRLVPFRLGELLASILEGAADLP